VSISEHEAKTLVDFETYEAEVATLRTRVAELEAMGEKVNAIRNSIVGLQCFNFSEHAYPLVAALNEAGFAGTPYPDARANVGTLLERANKAEARVVELEEGNVRRQVALEAELEGMRQRARVAEAQRDEAVSRSHESLTESVRAKADAARLREALEALVDRIDFVSQHDEYRAVWECAQLHRGPYRGPTYESAFNAARTTLASAPSAEPEGPDYSGLCSAPECGGHCGYVHAVGCEVIREYLAEHGGAPYKAPARTAHLAPGAEPTPRDMRVAEAVREACVESCDDQRYDASRYDCGRALLALDLAAVVAKALEVGT
jgi:hypothetical protein